MIDNTIEQIITQLVQDDNDSMSAARTYIEDSAGSNEAYIRQDIAERAMQAYADQEKRKEAIDFHTWIDNNNVPLYSGLTIAELYYVYIESLRVT